MSDGKKQKTTFRTSSPPLGPNVNNPGARGLESHAVDLSASRLEALVRILRRNTRGAAVGGDGRIVHVEEILERYVNTMDEHKMYEEYKETTF